MDMLGKSDISDEATVCSDGDCGRATLQEEDPDMPPLSSIDDSDLRNSSDIEISNRSHSFSGGDNKIVTPQPNRDFSSFDRHARSPKMMNSEKNQYSPSIFQSEPLKLQRSGSSSDTRNQGHASQVEKKFVNLNFPCNPPAIQRSFDNCDISHFALPAKDVEANQSVERKKADTSDNGVLEKLVAELRTYDVDQSTSDKLNRILSMTNDSNCPSIMPINEKKKFHLENLLAQVKTDEHDATALNARSKRKPTMSEPRSNLANTFPM